VILVVIRETLVPVPRFIIAMQVFAAMKKVTIRVILMPLMGIVWMRYWSYGRTAIVPVRHLNFD